MSCSARRRAFLQWLASTGLTLSILPRATAAIDETSPLPSGLETFLATLLQRLFPHQVLAPEVYAKAGLILAGAIEANSGLRQLAAAGQDALDAGGEKPWLQRPANAQLDALAANSNQAFFIALRGLGGLIFYSLPEVWVLLGYEGPSFDKGGYLARGFDDIDWLPDED
jgi:hypothetical protein